MPAGNGERRPLTTDGAVNPGEEISTSIAPHRDIPGLTPEQSRLLHNWIADVNHVPAERLAYVAVVEISEGKFRRRPFLTLAAAQNAIERAESRGVEARVYLAGLVQIGDLG